MFVMPNAPKNDLKSAKLPTEAQLQKAAADYMGPNAVDNETKKYIHTLYSSLSEGKSIDSLKGASDGKSLRALFAKTPSEKELLREANKLYGTNFMTPEMKKLFHEEYQKLAFNTNVPNEDARAFVEKGVYLDENGEMLDFPPDVSAEEREEKIRERARNGELLYFLPPHGDTPLKVGYDNLRKQTRLDPLVTEKQALPEMPSFMDRMNDFFFSFVGRRNQKCVAYDNAKRHNNEVERNEKLIKTGLRLVERREELRDLIKESDARKEADAQKEAAKQKEKQAPAEEKKPLAPEMAEEALLDRIAEKFGKEAVTDTLKGNIHTLCTQYQKGMQGLLDGFQASKQGKDTFTLGTDNAAGIAVYDAFLKQLEAGDPTMVQNMQKPGAATNMLRFARFSKQVQEFGENPHTVSDYRAGLLYAEGRRALADDVIAIVGELNPGLLAAKEEAPENAPELPETAEEPVKEAPSESPQVLQPENAGNFEVLSEQPQEKVLVPQDADNLTIEAAKEAESFEAAEERDIVSQMFDRVAADYGPDYATPELRENLQKLYDGFMESEQVLSDKLNAAEEKNENFTLGAEHVGNIAAYSKVANAIENGDFMLVNELQTPGMANNLQLAGSATQTAAYIGERDHTPRFFRKTLETVEGLQKVVDKTDEHLDAIRCEVCGTEAVNKAKEVRAANNRNWKEAHQMNNGEPVSAPLQADGKGPSEKAVFVTGNLYQEPGDSSLHMVSGDSAVVKGDNAAIGQAQKDQPQQPGEPEKKTATFLLSENATKLGSTMYKEPGDLDWHRIPGSSVEQFRKEYREYVREKNAKEASKAKELQKSAPAKAIPSKQMKQSQPSMSSL